MIHAPSQAPNTYPGPWDSPRSGDPDASHEDFRRAEQEMVYEHVMSSYFHGLVPDAAMIQRYGVKKFDRARVRAEWILQFIRRSNPGTFHAIEEVIARRGQALADFGRAVAELGENERTAVNFSPYWTYSTLELNANVWERVEFTPSGIIAGGLLISGAQDGRDSNRESALTVLQAFEYLLVEPSAVALAS